MTEEQRTLLSSYEKLAEFLHGSMGEHVHTAVYEVNTETGEGRVAAAFGPHFGRREGGPLTPFLRQIVSSLAESGEAGMTHVDTEASTAEGRVKLDMFAIRDGGGKMIGLLLLCTEIELMYQVRDVINRHLGYETDDTGAQETRLKATKQMGRESALLFSEYMQQRIREEIAACGIPVERMTNEERAAIVRRLEQLEVFYMKDSVKTTAELLGISVPTVYRLMKRGGAPAAGER